ncbi:sensor histidine kinase [Rhizohabitans arisaemae]|uniref:sensor histidine kinase n=1 Tax=Rhizohabitans arisaemae TaxID=2720610 RepID=UPI0024B0B8F1|nr:histidine kinase [Rhizohabitans arisaemae]
MENVVAWTRTLGDRLVPWLLPAFACLGAFFPAEPLGAGPYGLPLPWLASVPERFFVGLVAVSAAAMARTASARPWPLLLLAVVDSLLRWPGMLLFTASYVAATALRRPPVLLAYTALVSLVVVVPRPGVDIASTLGGIPVFVWLPLLLGLWMGARRQVVAGLRERAERLEREQAARTEQARAEERARIARDMHDVVAHRVSLMVLRAGALEVNAADERTVAEAELIRTTGQEALAQLRAVLGVLDKGDTGDFRPQPTLADLDWLLEQSRSVGVPVKLCEEGEADALPVMMQHTAYRVVQEALTNIHKHAGLAVTRVTLRHLPAALEVTVRNAAPQNPAQAVPGSGLGLVGLRERVELLGGAFEARPEPDGGFLVSARLPT